jgi:uncharacterized protein YkwD
MMSGGIRSLLALVAILAAAVVASPSGARTHDQGRTLAARDDLESGVLVEINALRRKHGLAPLRLNARLRAAADTHSAAMANRGFFSHDSADGTIFWKRVARFYPQGSKRYWSVGENLLWSSPDVDPAGALRMWLASAPHRKVLLTSRWQEVGLSAVHVSAGPGVFNNAPVTVLTADFGVRR